MGLTAPLGPVGQQDLTPLANKGPAALGCTFLSPGALGEFLTASLWAWRPLGRQAHKDSVRNPPRAPGLRNVQPRATGPLFSRAARPLLARRGLIGPSGPSGTKGP